MATKIYDILIMLKNKKFELILVMKPLNHLIGYECFI